MSGVIAGNSPVVSALKSKMTTMKQKIEDLETQIHEKSDELKQEIEKKEKVNYANINISCSFFRLEIFSLHAYNIRLLKCFVLLLILYKVKMPLIFRK